MLLTSVISTRRAELDWLYRGGGRFYPEAWERFRDYVGAAEYRSPLDAEPPIEGLLSAYAARLEDPDPQARLEAAKAWLAWPPGTSPPALSTVAGQLVGDLSQSWGGTVRKRDHHQAISRCDRGIGVARVIVLAILVLAVAG